MQKSTILTPVDPVKFGCTLPVIGSRVVVDSTVECAERCALLDTCLFIKIKTVGGQIECGLTDILQSESGGDVSDGKWFTLG